jgi:hypothetical protein
MSNCDAGVNPPVQRLGIMKEGEGIMAEYKDSPALDAALLAVAQSLGPSGRHRGPLPVAFSCR